MESAPKISKEQVVSKLKDDGDFDRLRLKIIRKLKDNEELRGQIISTVKQSAAFSRPGAENMKPRQLSDAIYEDVGSQVMGLISDNLWEIIRSTDGMKNEIRDTVQSTYNSLTNPGVLTGETDVASYEAGKVPQQLQLSLPGGHVHDQDQHNVEQQTTTKGSSEDMEAERCSTDDVDRGVPPGLSSPAESAKISDGIDDDPDLPPGFG